MHRSFLISGLLFVSQQAHGQNTANNAITQAEDAFGRSVGNERIGIYSNDEVRGFNPVEAGNNRLEGLYVDQPGTGSPRLTEGSTIRVGYAARNTPFPAPTGIVDTRIEKFTGQQEFAIEFNAEQRNLSGSLEVKAPIATGLGIALGVGFRDATQISGRSGKFLNYLAGVSWLPARESEIILFTAGFRGIDIEPTPVMFPSVEAPPPKTPRKLDQGQPWAINRNGTNVSGLIAKLPFDDFRLEAGLFRVIRDDNDAYFVLQRDIDASGRIGNLLVVADGNNRSVAWSGEFRVTRTWTGENLRHSLIASARGRDQSRAFGGQQRISLGASQLGVQDFRPRPAIVLGPEDLSNVRQITIGLQYSLQTRAGDTLNLAVQKADYRKFTDFTNPARTDTLSRDKPWLFSANGVLGILPGLSLYGGYVRGLEESALAPDLATNRDEAPPALLTRQMDIGLRYAVTPRLAVIFGAFDIRKPFYGLDAANFFTNLGTVSNRGLELSIAGTVAPGLTVVAGGILVDPKVSGPQVDRGEIGPRPVGAFGQRAIFNLDWRPTRLKGWSFDLALERVSGEMANRLNTFESPARFNANLGARYRFEVGDTKVLLRGLVQNVLDSYSWEVSNSGGFTFNLPRTFSFHLNIDF